jgi:hypothetical protein
MSSGRYLKVWQESLLKYTETNEDTNDDYESFEHFTEDNMYNPLPHVMTTNRLNPSSGTLKLEDVRSSETSAPTYQCDDPENRNMNYSKSTLYNPSSCSNFQIKFVPWLCLRNETEEDVFPQLTDSNKGLKCRKRLLFSLLFLLLLLLTR